MEFISVWEPLWRDLRVAYTKIILDRLHDLEIDDSKKEAIKPLPSFAFHGVSHLSLRFTPGNLRKLG